MTFNNFGTNLAKYLRNKKITHKNHVLAPIVGKDLKQKLFVEVVLRVLEGPINRYFF